MINAHREGRLPTLVTCTTTPALLDGIIRTLTPLAVEGVPSSAALFTRHRGNLREALRELYDVYAAAPDPWPCRKVNTTSAPEKAGGQPRLGEASPTYDVGSISPPFTSLKPSRPHRGTPPGNRRPARTRGTRSGCRRNGCGWRSASVLRPGRTS